MTIPAQGSPSNILSSHRGWPLYPCTEAMARPCNFHRHFSHSARGWTFFRRLNGLVFPCLVTRGGGLDLALDCLSCNAHPQLLALPLSHLRTVSTICHPPVPQCPHLNTGMATAPWEVRVNELRAENRGCPAPRKRFTCV